MSYRPAFSLVLGLLFGRTLLMVALSNALTGCFEMAKGR
jgi:hypothetical protein